MKPYKSVEEKKEHQYRVLGRRSYSDYCKAFQNQVENLRRMKEVEKVRECIYDFSSDATH